TAYLAEEQTDINDRVVGRRMAQSQLRRLQAEAGSDAFEQRAFKSDLKQAQRGIDVSNQSRIASGRTANGANPPRRSQAQADSLRLPPSQIAGAGRNTGAARTSSDPEPAAVENALPRVKQI